MCFQLLQIRSWKRVGGGEQGVENASTCFICIGRYGHTAAMGCLWEVSGCYRILLPRQIAEFIKYCYKIVSWLYWEVLCLSSKAMFHGCWMTFKKFVYLAEMNADLPHPSDYFIYRGGSCGTDMFMTSHGAMQENWKKSRQALTLLILISLEQEWSPLKDNFDSC